MSKFQPGAVVRFEPSAATVDRLLNAEVRPPHIPPLWELGVVQGGGAEGVVFVVFPPLAGVFNLNEADLRLVEDGDANCVG